MNYIIPFLFLSVILYGYIKKVKIYDVFVEGAKEALPLVFSLIPYLSAIFLMLELSKASGLDGLICKILSPFLKLLSIPEELTPLLIIKPFSGGGSYAILTEIYKNYGVDSLTGITASAIFGSSETVFYISAVYYSKCKVKRLARPIIISLVASLISAIFTSLICRLLY